MTTTGSIFHVVELLSGDIWFVKLDQCFYLFQILKIPLTGPFKSAGSIKLRAVAQHHLCFLNTGERVGDVAGTERTVYRFYPTKTELFQATVNDAMQRLTDQIEAAVAGIEDPFTYLRVSFRSYMAFFQANPDTVELFVQERAELGAECKPSYFVYKDAHSDQWLEMCRRMVASGRCRITDVGLIQDLIGNLAYGTILVNRISGRNAPLLGQAEDLLDAVMHGVLQP